MEVPKVIPVYFDQYVVEGIVKLNLWSGESGKLLMTPTVISEPTREKALEAVNDGGYGCENIDEADVSVYAVYKSNVEYSHGSISALVDDFDFTFDELVHAKRGV